jgi:NAD(P)-dependent dehydrogenase (short-subunit alcohol dehydrogenase family)
LHYVCDCGFNGQLNGTVVGMACDVREHDDVQRMIAATVARFGRLDVLVSDAGVGKFAPLGKLTPDDWRPVMQTNMEGVYYCSRGRADRHLARTRSR